MVQSFITKTENIKTGCGSIHFIYPDDLKYIKDFNVELRFKKTGVCEHAICEALSKTITWTLRKGYDIEELLEQWKGIRCEKPCLVEGGNHLSCPDAIAKVVGNILGKKECEK